MTKLTLLNLTNNQVSDILPLKENKGLGTGAVIYLQGNPLNDDSCKKYIPALEEQGVTVQSDCP